MVRQLGPIVALVAAVTAVVVLRATLMSVSHDVPDGSTLELELLASSRNPVLPHQTSDMTEALVLRCEQEVPAESTSFEPIRADPAEVGPDGVADPAAVESERFLVRLQPALDEDSTSKLTGCLEDLIVPRLKVEVVTARIGS